MPKISHLLVGAAMLLAPVSIASAEQIAGLTFDGKIVTFDSATPMTIASSFSITGLAAGDSLIGIDLRPANARIYGVSQTGRVYTLTTSGLASLVTTLSTIPTGTSFGIDFNPVPDRLRIISANGQNLRANVAGGATTVDTAITKSGGGAINLLGTAYTNSVPGGPPPASTVIYGIDSVTDSLMTSAAPNGGVYTTVGRLGVGLTNNNLIGFDISGATGKAYLNIDSAFYSVNLATGATKFIDTIGSGPLIGITATGAVPEPATWGMMILGFGIIGSTLRRRQRQYHIA
jgi:Domain of unknown function (DUF4394)/PEP-CTERM motif